MKHRASYRIVWLAVLLLPGCVNLTVNVYFPEPEIQQAAEAIESDIRGTALPANPSQTGLLYEVPMPGGAVLALAVRDKSACAQNVTKKVDIDIDIETPAILKIRESRKKRYKELEPFMDEGRLGEGLDGFVVIREPKGLGLREIQALKKLVEQENGDRLAIYREIAEAQDLNKEDIERIQEIFAKAIWKTMKPGHYFVKEVDKDGKIVAWMVKPEPEEEKKAPNQQ